MSRRLLVLACLLLLPLAVTQAQDETPDDNPYLAPMLGMIDELLEAGLTMDGANRAYFDAVANSEDPLYIAPLIDLWFFARQPISGFQEISDAVLNALVSVSGQDFDGNWRLYLEWASENDIALPPGYDEFKSALFTQLIDPRFADFFQPGVQDNANINLVEAVWGGVRVDGIPSLVNARQISPEEAQREGETITQFCNGDDCRYPAPDELVFGVSIDGDSRAYPLRLLNWHEMFNDVIGSATLYDAPNGEAVCEFRAPTLFRAVGQMDSEWVRIHGESAGCPEDGGWLALDDSLNWIDIDNTDTVLDALPDLNDSEPLAQTDGVVGQVEGTPVMLAYCTLCGAGILFDPVIDDLVVDGESLGETALEFGSTGLLMRSNKLMYDRNTNTVWNALTGTPAFGPLVGSGIQLDILPVVTTDWQTWLEEHPDTSVLSLETGFRRDYTNGAAYAQYFNDPDFLMFPVFQQDTTEQENKEMVFALNIDDTPKAYPIETLIAETVVNDTLAGQNVVIVARATPDRDFFEPGGAAVRAYEGGDYTFSPGETPLDLIDQNGDSWQVTESALLGPSGESLERLGGHLAFWFGWFSFHPDTLVYEGVS